MLVKPTRGAVLDKSHPLARGIVGCWLFNEGAGGKVFDLSGNGHYGTLHNNLTWTSSKLGTGIDFPGANNVGITVNGDLTTTNGQTILMWVYPRAYTSGYPRFFHQSSNNFEFGYRSTSYYLSVYDGSWHYSTTPIDWNVWQQVAVSYNGSKSRIYKNGVEVYSYDGGRNLNSEAVLLCTYEQETLDGIVSHAIIWGRGLSASEIAWLYREPFAMISIPSPPLVVISAGNIINAEGQIDGTSSASSTATVDWVVEASVSGTSSVTPDATVEWSAAVDVDAASTVTPDAVVDWGAVVDIDATSAVSPDAVVEWGAATQVDGESGLTVGAVVDWAAETTIGATSSVTPGATVDWSAATQIDATSGLTGTASIGEVFVEGTIGATSSVTVGAIVDWAAETSIAAAATVAADLTGLFSAVSSLTGTAQTGLLHSASGTISAVASIIGTLRNTRDANWTADTSTTNITWQNVSEDNDITWTLE